MRIPTILPGVALALVATLALAACDGATQPLGPIADASGAAASASDPLMAPSRPSPIEVSYTKTESGSGTFNWFGEVSGRINGNLETQVVGARLSPRIWHIQTVWTVTNTRDGAKNFVAHLNGTLDVVSGKLLLNGEIVSGFLAGAQVHEQGVLTGFTPAGGTIFRGTLWIMPGSAY